MKLNQNLGLALIRVKFKIMSAFSKKRAAKLAFELFSTPFFKTKKRTPSVFQVAERISFTLNGKIVKGYRWNYLKKDKIIILHGFNSAAHKFNRFVRPFIARGFEVMAFDAPAHGSSEGKTINAVEYAEMISYIIKHYGPLNNFIAHSFGGIALSLALENLETTKDTKIVFIAPATETTSAIDEAFKTLQINDEEVRKEFESIIQEKSGHTPEWFSIRRAIKSIHGNILWIHDKDDNVTPYKDVIPVIEDNNQHIKFHITQGLGHRRIYHDRDIQKLIFEFF